MKRIFGFVLAACLELPLGWTSSILDVTLERRLELADAVFTGQVASSVAFEPRPGVIRTRTIVRVEQVFKGRLPKLIKLFHRGGIVNGCGEFDGLSPQLKPGQNRLFFVARQEDGSLCVSLGPSGAPLLPASVVKASAPDRTASVAPPNPEVSFWIAELKTRTVSGALPGNNLTDQSATPADLEEDQQSSHGRKLNAFSNATNLLTEAGISARFLPPDRGEPIAYYVDADYLPAGMSLAQAMKSVEDALSAWSSVSSLKFVFGGMRSFGMASADIDSPETALYIQLHDAHGHITGGGELLGRGGNRWALQNLSNGWTLGGNVRGNDFHKVVCGWVVLQHANAAMQNPATFTEVLCHELGHAFSLAHSSNVQNEANPDLKQATMYYMVHADGRGASLNSFDTNVIRQLNPPDNTPPFCYDRIIDAITTPTNKTGFNAISFAGYDLQTTNLSLEFSEPTANAGTFTFVGNSVSYNANGYFNGPRLAPDSPESPFYDMVHTRAFDGTNASPFVTIRILSLNPDSYYEGVPNHWRLTHFGSEDPASGPNRRAQQDFDGDGFSNYIEWKLGSDPADKDSNLRISLDSTGVLQWDAMPFELYEIQGTTDQQTWRRVGSPVSPAEPQATAAVTFDSASRLFRVLKVQ